MTPAHQIERVESKDAMTVGTAHGCHFGSVQ
jgi:hypothetical protein